ncbi:putative T7SS-secreted protein [Streptomyces sp. NPDC048057]|uniref:putative T7SS-secreted protein n=1 Tax=Streptomyces sp. NPDC048057 TaxID=3155628 RepID=UPI0033FDEFA9
MAARPGDWSSLGLGGDPTPGDPAVIVLLADAMKTLAQAAGTVNTGLREIQNTSGEGQRFIGKTADMLREKVDEHLHGFAGAVEGSFYLAESAMRTYATALETAQGEADTALSAAQKLPEDDPQRQALAEGVTAARTELSNAVNRFRSQLDEAGDMMKQPSSDCEIFWEVFEILTIIVSILAIFTGGLLGIIAWAMNAVNLIKVAVDYSQGKASGLELGLAFLGVLFPSTKGIGGTLKAIGKGIKAGGAGFVDEVGKIALMTGTSRFLVVPFLLGAKTWAGAKGILPGLWGGMKYLGRLPKDDWTRITGLATGNMDKFKVYGLVTLDRFGRFMAAAVLPVNFVEIGVVGFRGAAALAFADRVLGIPQHSLRQMMVKAGDLEYLMKAGNPGRTGWGAGLPGVGSPLGGPLGAAPGGPGFGTVTTDLFHLSVGKMPVLNFTDLGFAKLGDLLLNRPGATMPGGTGAVPGLITPPLPGNLTVSPGGLLLPKSTVGTPALDPLTRLDASAGTVRLDSNLLLPADTAIGVVDGARHPAGLSVVLDAPGAGRGAEASDGLSRIDTALDDSNVLARSAVGHSEDLADLKLPELLALQNGDVAVRSVGADGISFRIGADTDVTVNAESLAAIALTPPGSVPGAALPNTGALTGATGTPGVTLPGGTGLNAATPGGAVPGAGLTGAATPPLTAAPGQAATPPAATPGAATGQTSLTPPPAPGRTSPSSAATGTPPATPVPKGADAPVPSPATALDSRQQALSLLRGDDARPRTPAGMSASASSGGVSSRAPLDAAGVAPIQKADADRALDLVARPRRGAEDPGTPGTPPSARPATPVPAAPTPVRPESPVGVGDVRPAKVVAPTPTRIADASVFGPAAPVPTRIEGHAAATFRNQLRLSIGNVITGGTPDRALGDLRMERYVAYEESLVRLRTAQRRADEGAPSTPGAGSSSSAGPAPGAKTPLDVAVAEVKDARKALRDVGVDPDGTLNEVRSLNVRMVVQNGGVPGGAGKPDLSRVLADEADEAADASSAAGRAGNGATAGEDGPPAPGAGQADGPVPDELAPDGRTPGGPAPDGLADDLGRAPDPAARPEAGRVDNPYAGPEGSRTRAFVSDPVRFLRESPVTTDFTQGIKARMPGLSDELANKFVKMMGETDRNWFVLVREGADPAASRGTLVLTPAVERYVQAFLDGDLFRATDVVAKTTRELFEKLAGHPAMLRPIADDDYLASGFIPYKSGNAKKAKDIGKAVISRNPESRVGSDFVFTPEMNGCALTITDVDEHVFRAWHYQSPNGPSAIVHATNFRVDRSPTDWIGDAAYLSTHTGREWPGATNILWRQPDGSWRFLSQEYLADITATGKMDNFQLRRQPRVLEVSLTPGNEYAYTSKIYNAVRDDDNHAVLAGLEKFLKESGGGASTQKVLRTRIADPLARAVRAEGDWLAGATDFAGLVGKLDVAKGMRSSAATSVLKAVGESSLNSKAKAQLNQLVGDFKDPRWLREWAVEADKRVKANADAPAATDDVTPPSTGDVTPPAVGDVKGKGRAVVQDDDTASGSTGGLSNDHEVVRVWQERARVRRDIIVGETTGDEARARLDAFDAYDVARTELAALQGRAARELPANDLGSSTGLSASQRLLRRDLDAAYRTAFEAADDVRAHGIDPVATSARIDAARANVHTGGGALIGGGGRGTGGGFDAGQGWRGHPPQTNAPQAGGPSATNPVDAADAADAANELEWLDEALASFGPLPAPAPGAAAGLQLDQFNMQFNHLNLDDTLAWMDSQFPPTLPGTRAQPPAPAHPPQPSGAGQGGGVWLQPSPVTAGDPRLTAQVTVPGGTPNQLDVFDDDFWAGDPFVGSGPPMSDQELEGFFAQLDQFFSPNPPPAQHATAPGTGTGGAPGPSAPQGPGAGQVTWTNADFRALGSTTPAGPMEPGEYLDFVRRSADGGNRIAYVVNVIASAGSVNDVVGFQRFLNALTHRLDDGFRGRFAVVVGVNGTGFADAVRTVPQQLTFPHPLAVVGTPLPAREGPFALQGTARNLTLTSPATQYAIRSMMERNHHPYVAVVDFDAYPHTVPSGRHVFRHFEQSLDGTRPLMMTGGYRTVGEGDVHDLRDPGAQALLRERAAGYSTDFTQRLTHDMRVRGTASTTHPMVPYGPEPNLFVDGAATLLDLRNLIPRNSASPRATSQSGLVRFGDGSAEFNVLSQRLNVLNTWELDQRLPLPPMPPGFPAGAASDLLTGVDHAIVWSRLGPTGDQARRAEEFLRLTDGTAYDMALDRRAARITEAQRGLHRIANWMRTDMPLQGPQGVAQAQGLLHARAAEVVESGLWYQGSGLPLPGAFLREFADRIARGGGRGAPAQNLLHQLGQHLSAGHNPLGRAPLPPGAAQSLLGMVGDAPRAIETLTAQAPDALLRLADELDAPPPGYATPTGAVGSQTPVEPLVNEISTALTKVANALPTASPQQVAQLTDFLRHLADQRLGALAGPAGDALAAHRARAAGNGAVPDPQGGPPVPALAPDDVHRRSVLTIRDAYEERLTRREIDAANHALPERGAAFHTEFESAAIPTDLDRLVRDFNTGTAQNLKQDHVPPKPLTSRLLGQNDQNTNARSAMSGVRTAPYRKDYMTGNTIAPDVLHPRYNRLDRAPQPSIAQLAAQLDPRLGDGAVDRIARHASQPVPGGGSFGGLRAGIDPANTRIHVENLALSADTPNLLRHLRYLRDVHLPGQGIAAPQGSLFATLNGLSATPGARPSLADQMLERVVNRFDPVRAGQDGLTDLDRLDRPNAQAIEAGLTPRDLFVRLATGRVEAPGASGRGLDGAMDRGGEYVLRLYAHALGHNFQVIAADGASYPIDVGASNTVNLYWRGRDGGGWNTAPVDHVRPADPGVGTGKARATDSAGAPGHPGSSGSTYGPPAGGSAGQGHPVAPSHPQLVQRVLDHYQLAYLQYAEVSVGGGLAGRPSTSADAGRAARAEADAALATFQEARQRLVQLGVNPDLVDRQIADALRHRRRQ